MAYIGQTTNSDEPAEKSSLRHCLRASLYPFTKEAAFVAGRLDAERQLQGINVPYADLLIAATALSLGFSVITTNLRDFQRIPELRVLKF